MSVVKRPASLTTMFNVPAIKYNDHELSRETCFKAASAKHYFKNHYRKLSKDANERFKRYDALKKKISSCEFSNEEQFQIEKSFTTEESLTLRKMRMKLKVEQYEKLQLIGQGGYGDVYLAYDRRTTELCALKILSKAKIILDDQVANVRSEREILSQSENQWIVELKHSFQDDHNLYLVLEFVQGGDLMSLLMKYNTLSQNVAKFYTAEIISAVNSVHQLGFVHRDIKPDNILISETGHLKLTDFGLATRYTKQQTTLSKLLDQLQDMLCERENMSFTRWNQKHHKIKHQALSIDYAAPEVLLGKRPTRKSDFWSVGIILYEMLYGFPPFSAQTPEETALRIIRWPEALHFMPNKNVSIDAIDLMRKLLCYEENRLTFDEIIKHPFFKGFNFDDPFSCKPPLVPTLQSPSDTSYFDKITPIKEGEFDQITPKNDLTQFAFLGFTYNKRPNNKVLANLGIYA